MMKFLLGYVFVLLIALVVPTGSIALNRIDVVGIQLSQLIHIVIFIPWGIGCIWWIRRHPESTKTSFGLSFFIFVLLAVPVFAECIQIFFSHRSFEILEMILNLSGTVIGVVIGETAFRISRSASASGDIGQTR